MFTLKPKNCVICGREFIPTNPRQKYCKNTHYRLCPICGKSYAEDNLDKFKQPPTTCSMECRVKKRTQTSIEKYGITAPGNNPEAREKSRKTMNERYGVNYAQESEKIRQKSINTCVEKYGVDNPQKNDEIKRKTTQTNVQRYGSKTYLTSEVGKEVIDKIMQDKYGTTIPLQNPDIREKLIATNIQRYGVANPLQNKDVQKRSRATSLAKYGTVYPQSSEIVKQRVKDTFIRNYGVDNCFKSKDIIEKIHRSFYDHYGVHGVMDVKEIADRIVATNLKRYGVPYGVMMPNARRSSGSISKINKTIANRLNEAGLETKLEFTIKNRGYDIRILGSDLLIEINPSYTHNSLGNHWNHKGISRYYHLHKSLLAKKYGYRCIHLWDWDCPSKFIQSLTTKHIIYNSSIPEIIHKEEAVEFIEKYGIYDVTSNIPNIAFIGIRYKTKLITIIGFRQLDTLINSWELVCIENRFNYTIYGGHSKILEAFIRQYNPSKIVSYADFSKTNGESLEALGFEYKKYIFPNRIWSKGRHAIIDDPTINAEAMIADKWMPVYNCGYKLYEKYICTPKILQN